MPYKEMARRMFRQKCRRYEWRKAGLCVDCGRPSLGKYRCFVHEALKNMRAIKYRNKNREKLRKESIKYRKRLEENNQCLRCGAPLIEDETRYCVYCITRVWGRHEPQIKGVLKYETAD